MPQNTSPQSNFSFSALVASFSPEISGLVHRYSRPGHGNLWEADIAQEARYALFLLIQSGKVIPDPQTGLLSEQDRRIACVAMKSAVHRAIPVLRSGVSISISTLDNYRRLREEFGRLRPGINPADCDSLEVSRVLGIGRKTAANLIALGHKGASLDAPLSENEGGSLGDHLKDDELRHPAEKLQNQESAVQMSVAMNRLSPLQRETIERRFGLKSGEEESCASIAESRKCARQSVDEVARTALRHMREALAAA